MYIDVVGVLVFSPMAAARRTVGMDGQRVLESSRTRRRKDAGPSW